MSIARSTKSASEIGGAAPGAASRRRFLRGAAAAVALPWLAECAARRRRRALRARRRVGPAARRQRRALDARHRRRIAGARCGALGSRRRRALPATSSRAARKAPKRPGRTASTPSRPGSSRRAGTGTASARSASRAPIGRTRTAPAADAAATLRFAIASCQRYDVGHYAAWRHMAADESRPRAVPRRLHLRIRDAGRTRCAARGWRGAHARAVPRPLRHLQERPGAAGSARAAPWLDGLGRPRGRERLRRPAGRGPRARLPRAPRRRLSRVLGAHAVSRSRRARATPTCASSAASTGAAWRASTCSTTASTAIRRSAREPGRGGSNTVALVECPALLDPARTLLGAEQEAWLADGWDLGRPWNLLAQQTLMARFTWRDPARSAAAPTGPTAGTATRRRATRLSRPIAASEGPGGRGARRRRAQQLRRRPEARLRRPGLAGRRQRVLRHLDHQPVGIAQSRVDAARAFNPHIRYGRADQRGYMRFELDAKQLRAALRGRRRPLDPASGITTAARFVVDAARQAGGLKPPSRPLQNRPAFSAAPSTHARARPSGC